MNLTVVGALLLRSRLALVLVDEEATLRPSDLRLRVDLEALEVNEELVLREEPLVEPTYALNRPWRLPGISFEQ